MKLWEKGVATHQFVETFTVGKDRELDILLAKHDVLGTLAHITMLAEIGLLQKDELPILKKELIAIYASIVRGEFQISPEMEDVHSQIEWLLTQKLGEMGKKVHSGRSRNDQVLLDVKLFTRQALKEVVETTKELFDLLLVLSEKYKDVLLAGYTHFQVAMPSSFGLWFGAYAESLTDDLLLLQSVYEIANQNPLGSAAGYGSSFPLNRQLTTDLLGFKRLNYNVVYAQMNRGKLERLASVALANIATTVGKMAMDICLYMSQNFDFVSFPDEFTTGSSIMPHKKNPDVFELVRGKCNQLQALPNEIALLTANLPSGYHRDWQLLKEHFLPAFGTLKDCLTMMQLSLQQIRVKENILEDEKYKYIFSVDYLNQKVLADVPFRDAYREVAAEIAAGTFAPTTAVVHTHEGSIGNLCNEAIATKMQMILQRFDFEAVEKAERLLLEEI